MDVNVGVSNRHIHLTEEDYRVLFGNVNIEIAKRIVQAGQFASFSKVTIQTEKSELKNVRVLGPFRKYTQVEISKTDAFKLGINPPIRTSGDLTEAATVTIIGPSGRLKLPCCIIANRHIHMNEEEANRRGFVNKQTVSVTFNTEKPVTFHDVFIKVSSDGVYQMHIDTDDANGSFIKDNDIGNIIT